MDTNLDLRDIERRPAKYWNIDGLPELMMGFLWIVWGGAWLAGQRIPRGSAWNLYWLFAPALLVLSGFAATWATKQLKQRITFPRTGYVEWSEPSRAQRSGGVGVAMVTAAMLTTLIVKGRTGAFGDVAAPAMGAMCSVAFLTASFRQRAPHLLVLAGVSLALGLAFGAWSTGWDALNWLFVCLGAASVAVGAVRLRGFLKHNPVEARQ